MRGARALIGAQETGAGSQASRRLGKETIAAPSSPFYNDGSHESLLPGFYWVVPMAGEVPWPKGVCALPLSPIHDAGGDPCLPSALPHASTSRRCIVAPWRFHQIVSTGFDLHLSFPVSRTLDVPVYRPLPTRLHLAPILRAIHDSRTCLSTPPAPNRPHPNHNVSVIAAAQFVHDASISLNTPCLNRPPESCSSACP